MEVRKRLANSYKRVLRYLRGDLKENRSDDGYSSLDEIRLSREIREIEGEMKGLEMEMQAAA